MDHVGLPRAMTNSSGQLVWNTYPKPYADISEKTLVDPISGRTVVTNLRLPGQYDERLFATAGITGLQVPGVGRYLELDRVALKGDFNWDFGPVWYGYANENPLRFTDPTGLKVWVCYRVANIPLNVFRLAHRWFKTDKCGEMGMGRAGGGVPGQGNSDFPGVPTTWNDHSGQSKAPGVVCEEIDWIDEDCLCRKAKIGTSTGRWWPWNQCWSQTCNTATSCMKSCSVPPGQCH